MQFLLVTGGVAAAMLVGAAVLHLVGYFSDGGRVSAALSRAPWLDLLITYFTVLPLVVGPVVAGWAGFAGAVAGMLAALVLWTIAHELVNPQARGGPRIVSTINRKVGMVRNLTAVYWTAIVLPCFWIVRMAEVFVYPPLTWLVQLPKYRGGDWVNVSRHKFRGLVGHDLIWCLYCDWMTGVWSLGSEMLRNVESFWCPIRFASDKKCANCAVDFPDVEQGWVPADGTMADVTRTLERMYPPQQHPRAWFGHPVRLTVHGRKPEPAAAATVSSDVG